MVALWEAPLARWLLVEGASPERVRDGAGDPLDEGLAKEGRARPAPVDPVLVAAAFGDGRDAGVLLEGGGVGEALALLAEGGEQACREDAAGTGQICEETRSREAADSDGRSRRRGVRCRRTRRGAAAGAPRREGEPAR